MSLWEWAELSTSSVTFIPEIMKAYVYVPHVYPGNYDE